MAVARLNVDAAVRLLGLLPSDVASRLSILWPFLSPPVVSSRYSEALRKVFANAALLVAREYSLQLGRIRSV